jgi:hypothetical protein
MVIASRRFRGWTQVFKISGLANDPAFCPEKYFWLGQHLSHPFGYDFRRNGQL